MSDKKLVLVIDKSKAYLNFQEDYYLKQWGLDRADSKKVKSLESVGMDSLFGDSPCSIIELEELDHLKMLVKEIEEKDEDDLNNILNSGLIIVSGINRNSTKKLESLVKSIGGDVIVPPGKKDTPVPIKLLSTLSLRKEVKDFILSYVGDDYELILPLILSLSSLPQKSHHLIKEEDIFIRFPQSRGSLPPWEIEKPLLKGDVEDTIDIFRRIEKHSSALPILAILKNKFQLSYRIAAIKSMERDLKEEEIAEILDKKKDFQFTLAYKNASSLGLQKLLRIVNILEEIETDIKGGSSAPSNATFEVGLIKICNLMNSKK